MEQPESRPSGGFAGGLGSEFGTRKTAVNLFAVFSIFLKNKFSRKNMLSEKIVSALGVLLEKFSGQNINWAVVGSTNLALQGFTQITPDDIDILTDMEGAFLMNELLAEYCQEPVKYVETEKFKSYRGLFKIEGVKVEVLGDIQSRTAGEDLWTATARLTFKKFVECRGLQIPVVSLEQEYIAYLKMGEMKKAKQIKDFIGHHSSTNKQIL